MINVDAINKEKERLIKKIRELDEHERSQEMFEEEMIELGNQEMEGTNVTLGIAQIDYENDTLDCSKSTKKRGRQSHFELRKKMEWLGINPRLTHY